MKKIIMILSLSLALFGYTLKVNADTVCYDVEGEVITYNTSPLTQSGIMELSLTNQVTGEEVSLEGNINGMITGGSAEGAIYLSHTVTSNDESTPYSFTTLNDLAVIVGAPEGCTIPVSETITNITGGTGFSENVVSVGLVVNGSINIINEGECLGVPNTFEDIYGQMCVDQ